MSEDAYFSKQKAEVTASRQSQSHLEHPTLGSLDSTDALEPWHFCAYTLFARGNVDCTGAPHTTAQSRQWEADRQQSIIRHLTDRVTHVEPVWMRMLALLSPRRIIGLALLQELSVPIG